MRRALWLVTMVSFRALAEVEPSPPPSGEALGESTFLTGPSADASGEVTAVSPPSATTQAEKLGSEPAKTQRTHKAILTVVGGWLGAITGAMAGIVATVPLGLYAIAPYAILITAGVLMGAGVWLGGWAGGGQGNLWLTLLFGGGMGVVGILPTLFIGYLALGALPLAAIAVVVMVAAGVAWTVNFYEWTEPRAQTPPEPVARVLRTGTEPWMHPVWVF